MDRTSLLLSLLLTSALPLAACSHNDRPPPSSAATTATAGGQGYGSVAAALSRAQRGRGEFDQAERTLSAAESSAQASGDRASLGDIAAAKVWLLADRSFYGDVDPVAARKTIDDARRVARESGSRGAQATVIDAAAFYDYRDILFNGGSYTKVRNEFQQALSAYEAVGDFSGQAMSLFHIGLTYEEEGRKAEARPFYQRSAASAERADDPATLSFPVRHLGFLYAEEGKLDEALRHQRRCLFLRIRAGLTLNVPYAYIAVGDAEFAKGDPGRARIYFNDALDLGREQHSDSVSLEAHKSLGKVDERENHKDAAARHYQEALSSADKLKRNSDVKEICESLTRVYQQMGDRDKAQFYGQRAREADHAMKAKN
ncbi:tetratricopeptide repeat protein [Pendulispora rubella]|uniref:Tetratricopeptide repeat protein n=1 Tax=Pendulispora rubella TaxID=2741070 RepID=A0ABZ2LID3_9BACT